MLFSCKKENTFDCFKSTGSETTEVRSPGNFQTITINDKINATIFKGSDYKVEVVAGKHLLRNISTKIVKGTLNIVDNNTCNFVRGYNKKIQINITVPYVKSVFNDGVGTVDFADDFTQDTLLVKAGNSGDIYVNGVFNEVRTSSHGNGDIYFNGSANSFYIYTNGTNFLRAANFKVANYVFIETYSIGDCYIDATGLNTLEFNIHKDGNIYYTGQPNTITDFSTYSRRGRALKL